MWRKLFLFSFLSFAVLAVDFPSASAAPISRQNPYRSFNISGINYGSMKWEQQHRGQMRRTGGRRVFFRR